MRAGDVVGGRFLLRSVAGEGGMGVVWRAQDRLTESIVAVKVVLRLRPEDAARFAREVRSLAALSHPGIVRYVDHGTSSAGEPYLVMEWLEGEDLDDCIARGPLSVADTLAVGRGVAAALAVAHRKDIVHRDIKPSNLWLPEGEPERVKLIDFGIARDPRIPSGVTRAGVALGTPGYMSPEQALGEAVDARTDAFALGCVLWECLTGAPAFPGQDPHAILLKIVLEKLPLITTIRPEVPPALASLLEALMAKDVTQRPPDGTAIAEALERIEVVPESQPPAPVILEDLGDAEQRTLCVLLVQGRDSARDTVASDVSELEQACDMDELRRVVARHGGRSFHLLDGSFAVTLDAPGTATDQVAQAALCALALHGVLPAEAIAVATGRAVIGVRVPVGEAIDRAAAMLRAAESNNGVPAAASVRLDDVTAALLDPRFVVVGAPSDRRLLGVHERGGEARMVAGRATSCVGREGELALLRALFDECLIRPASRAALVTGPPGGGKSRLRFELLRRISGRGMPPETWLARGDPMSAGSPFGLLGQLLRGAAGLRRSHDPSTRRTGLVARVARFVEPSEVGRVAAFLGEMAGSPFPDDDDVQLRAARRDPVLMGDQMRRAWRDFVVAECRHHPHVLIVEDLHWGDVPTVRLLTAALREASELPLFVLALGRPEVRTMFPELFEAGGIIDLQLGALTAESSADIVRQVLGTTVDDAVVRRLVERAAGNALYLEELIRAVAEGSDGELPPTVAALLGARLGALPDPLRRTLRVASIFGRTFWSGGLLALLGEPTAEVEAQLLQSVDRELVVQRRESRFADEAEYSFRHALVREAAYGMLTDEDRRLGHRLAGAWLESRGETDPTVLAEHFERGGALLLSARWWRRAAEQALDGNDLDAVRTRCERARACGAQGEERGELWVLEARALRWQGMYEAARGAAVQAIGLLPRFSPGWCRAATVEAAAGADLLQVEPAARRGAELCSAPPEAGPAAAAALATCTTILLMMGRPELTGSLLARLDALAAEESARDPIVASTILQARAAAALFRGETERSLHLAGAVRQQAELGGDPRAACNAILWIGVALGELGAIDDAIRALEETQAEALRQGLAGYHAVVRLNLVRLCAGRTPRADVTRELSDLMELLRAHGNGRILGGAYLVRAEVLEDAGDFAGALRDAEAALELHADIPHARCRAVSALAGALRGAGRDREAVERAREALLLLDSLGGLDMGEARVRLTAARVFAAAGRSDEARAILRAARERLRVRAAAIVDSRLRTAFLNESPDNAAVLAQARVWLADEADQEG